MLLCRLVCGRRDRRRSGRGGWVIGSRKSLRELRKGRSIMSSTRRRSTGCRSAGSSCTMWVWSDVVRKRGKWWASCSDWLWIFCDNGKGKWDQSWSYAGPNIVQDPDVLIDKRLFRTPTKNHLSPLVSSSISPSPFPSLTSMSNNLFGRVSFVKWNFSDKSFCWTDNRWRQKAIWRCLSGLQSTGGCVILNN